MTVKLPDVRLTIDLLECSLRHPLSLVPPQSLPLQQSQSQSLPLPLPRARTTTLPVLPHNHNRTPLSPHHNAGSAVVSGTPTSTPGSVSGSATGIASGGASVVAEPIIPDFGRFETEEELLAFMSAYSDRYTTGPTPSSTPTSNYASTPATPTSQLSTGGRTVRTTPTSSTPTFNNISPVPVPPPLGIARKDLLVFRAQVTTHLVVSVQPCCLLLEPLN